MERRAIPESEHRLVILCALRALGPVTDEQLLQFMADGELMNWFTLQPALLELEEQGQILRTEGAIGSLITLTEEGRYTLETFTQRIPQSRRDTIGRLAPELKRRFRLEQQTPAERIPLPDGRSCVRLRLLEGGTALL